MKSSHFIFLHLIETLSSSAFTSHTYFSLLEKSHIISVLSHLIKQTLLTHLVEQAQTLAWFTSCVKSCFNNMTRDIHVSNNDLNGNLWHIVDNYESSHAIEFKPQNRKKVLISIEWKLYERKFKLYFQHDHTWLTTKPFNMFKKSVCLSLSSLSSSLLLFSCIGIITIQYPVRNKAKKSTTERKSKNKATKSNNENRQGANKYKPALEVIF